MKASQWDTGAGEAKRRAQEYKYRLNRLMDFLDWLYDNDMSHTSLSESQNEFERWEDKQNEKEKRIRFHKHIKTTTHP